MTVSVTREGDIARVTLDNPPVNALGQAQRAGLADAVAQTNAMDGLRAVVLHCAGRSFVAGADIREFGKPPIEPAFARCSGADRKRARALGGGHSRHRAGRRAGTGLGLPLPRRGAGAKLGLPEVTLGLIPGAGGTVRLPRIIAASDALSMVAGGKPVGAARAAEWGLVDAVAEGGVLEQALQFAATLAEHPRPRAPC